MKSGSASTDWIGSKNRDLPGSGNRDFLVLLERYMHLLLLNENNYPLENALLYLK